MGYGGKREKNGNCEVSPGRVIHQPRITRWPEGWRRAWSLWWVSWGCQQLIGPWQCAHPIVSPSRCQSLCTWCVGVCAVCGGRRSSRDAQAQVAASENTVCSPSLQWQEGAVCFCTAKIKLLAKSHLTEGAWLCADPSLSWLLWLGVLRAEFLRWWCLLFEAEEGFEINGGLLCSMCARALALRGRLAWPWANASVESPPGGVCGGHEGEDAPF